MSSNEWPKSSCISLFALVNKVRFLLGRLLMVLVAVSHLPKCFLTDSQLLLVVECGVWAV